MFQKVINNEMVINFNNDDVLINLAWSYLDNFRSFDHITKCLPEHINFFEKAFSSGLRNVTCIGTCLEYGIKEGELEETMPSDPHLPYAIAKDSLRRYFEYKREQIGLKLKWVRLFYIYGENQSPRTIYGQLVKAVVEKQEVFDMSLGQQKRDYLHVDAVARIILYLALIGEDLGIVNCCSGVSVTIVDFVNLRLKELKGHLSLNLGKYPYPTYEGMNFWGSNKKLNKILGAIK